jgi:hypothetical protein
VPWPEIDRVIAATWTDTPVSVVDRTTSVFPPLPPLGPEGDADATRVIRARRSAVAFDGETRLGKDSFFGLLDSLLPRSVPPFSSFPFAPRVHLGLFVHRVDGLEPGLYILVRRLEAQQELAALMREELLWERVPDAPPHLPLYQLATGDLGDIAQFICCHQEIAKDAAFSLGMLAELERTLNELGPYGYRSAFWETGVIGQALYLGAEARNLRGTGIGCFFDDEMHRLLGISDHRLQSLYHFAFGGPVDDPRIATLPDYPRRSSS